MPSDFSPNFIVDAGANIGITALYFATKYPAAQIVAIEPDESNYALLQQNCKDLTNITTRHAALWSRVARLASKNLRVDKWAFQYREESTDSSAVSTITIPHLLELSPTGFIDLLKVDIEGAERDLFDASAQEWLPKIRYIAIEMHDRFIPGCSHSFYSQLVKYPFSQDVRGENILVKLG